MNLTTKETVTVPPGDHLSLELQDALASFLCLALLVGVTGNLMTIYIIATKPKLRTHSNVYVINLAVADILLLSVNLPTTIMEFFNGENDIVFREYCRYTSPINIMTMICALNSVAAVGFNRFLILCKSKSVSNKFSKKSSVGISLAVIWLWSFCIVFPPMVGYGEFGYHTKFRTCFFKANDEESWMYGTIFCCVLGVFPPVMASMFFYSKILLKLSANKRNLMRHYLPPISKITTNVSLYQRSTDELIDSKKVDFQEPTNQNRLELPNQKRKKKKKKPKAQPKTYTALLRQNNHQRRSVMMLVTVFIVIVICWLPISVSFIVDRHNRLPSIVYVAFVILAWVNSCVNIFIYAGMNLQFRRAYKALLTRPFAKSSDLATTTSGSGLGTKGIANSTTESKS